MLSHFIFFCLKWGKKNSFWGILLKISELSNVVSENQ